MKHSSEVDRQRINFLMKIGNVEVKVSVISIGVLVFFTIFLILASLSSPDVRSNLIWLIPVLFMLLVILVVLNYMSRSL